MRLLVIVLFSMISLLRCDREIQTDIIGYIHADFTPKYKFNHPDKVLQLDTKLNEISGLCYNTKRDVLYTINDEKGKMYTLDKSTGKITSTLDIGKKGDYEGIATIDDIVYITRSNGKITVFDLHSNRVREIIDNALNVNNDIEGLDIAPNGHLILACKAKGLKKKSKPRNSYLYSLDPTRVSEVSTFLELDLDKTVAELPSVGIEESNYPQIFKNRFSRHYPSGIAFDGTAGLLYILSAKNNTIAIVDMTDKKIKALLALDTEVHGQPEGITLDAEGTLYISNEAAGGLAVINVYHPTINQ